MSDDEKQEETKKVDVNAVWSEILNRDELKEFHERVPDLFKVLAEEFQKNKNVEIRQRIKSNFTSLLTVISTDTDYSDVPSNAKKGTRLGSSVENTFNG